MLFLPCVPSNQEFLNNVYYSIAFHFAPGGISDFGLISDCYEVVDSWWFRFLDKIMPSDWTSSFLRSSFVCRHQDRLAANHPSFRFSINWIVRGFRSVIFEWNILRCDSLILHLLAWAFQWNFWLKWLCLFQFHSCLTFYCGNSFFHLQS